MDEAIALRLFAREAIWTESLAVGSQEFVGGVEESIRNRRSLETGKSSRALAGSTEPDAWFLREEPSADAYDAFSAPKIASMPS
jgi:hypothetical protein